MQTSFNVVVKPIEPKRIIVGMWVVFNNMLLQVNDKVGSEWLLGTSTVNVSQEPEFKAGSQIRVFQPVTLETSR